MGIVRDLYYARKMSAGLKLPAPTVALLIKRLRLAAAMGGGGIEKTVSGTMVHITDALAKAALSVLVNITPIQPGSGDPSPENVRPISGLTGLAVYRHGKNLLNAATNVTGYYISSSGVIKQDSGTPSSQYTDLIPVEAGKKYTLSLISNRTATGNNRVHGYDSNGNWVKEISHGAPTIGPDTPFKLTGTIDSGISYVRISYAINDVDAMYEEGNSQTSYEQFTYNTYDEDWSVQAGTVYGGTLDVVTGELVVDRGRVNVSSSWYWNKSGSYPGGFYAAIENAGTGQKTNTPFICSHAKTATSISQYVQDTCFCDGSINIRIMDGSDTVQDWKDYINAQITAGTPIQICYELSTPLTYQLTPQEVQMLLGENYVWSSSGDTVSVTYISEGNANNRQALNILLGGNYSNPKTADDVSDKEALEIILGGNK